MYWYQVNDIGKKVAFKSFKQTKNKKLLNKNPLLWIFFFRTFIEQSLKDCEKILL